MTFENFNKWIYSGNHSKKLDHLFQRKITYKDFYIRAFDIIDRLLMERKIITKSLDEINDIDELQKIEKDFFADPDLIELNKRGNGMYQAAFIFLIQCKSEMQNGPIEQNLEDA